MAPPTKTAKAYKAMKAYGFSEELVKAVLKDLLHASGNKWQLIERENYRVLLETLFERQDSMRNEVKEQEFKLRDESEEEEYEQPLKKSRTNIQNTPSFSTDDPCPLAITRSSFRVEHEEEEILKNTASFPGDYEGKGKELQFFPVMEQTEASQMLAIEVKSQYMLSPRSTPKVFQRKKRSTPWDEVPLAVIHPDGSSTGIFCGTEETFLEPPNIIHLDAGNIASSEQFYEDRHSDQNLSGHEGKNCGLDSNFMGTEDNEDDSPLSSKIHIASSLKGEVKMSFIFNSPQPSKFQIPSVDAVLNHMEDKYRKSFGILDTGFSFSNLLKDLCEGFLERAPVSMDSEQVPVDVPEPSLDTDSLYYVDDITRANEKQKISLVNGYNNKKLPTSTYIPKNAIFHSAYVKFVLVRISDDSCCSNCSGDCMSQEIPCACACAGESGGEFAYTSEGLIKEEFLERCVSIKQKPHKKNYFYCDGCPLERTNGASKSGKCKGHLVKRFIKECWYKCGCNLSCGNRVVQRGITAHLQVLMTPEGKGWSIRTHMDIPKGAFVCEYVGEIVTNNELLDRSTRNSNARHTYELLDRSTRNSNARHTYPVLLDADWGSEGVLRDEEALCLDATSFGNVAKYNDAIMVEIPVEVESPDHHYYHLAFFTTREVKAFEELTWDYGIDFSDNSHPVKAFKCRCGSKYCRDMKCRKRPRT